MEHSMHTVNSAMLRGFIACLLFGPPCTQIPGRHHTVEHIIHAVRGRNPQRWQCWLLDIVARSMVSTAFTYSYHLMK